MIDGDKRTRIAYIVEALFEYMVSLLVTGTFLSAILKEVGVSDSLTGIVSSLTSVACAAQVFSGILRRPGRSVKRIIVVLSFVNRLMLSVLYFIPFLPFGTGVKVILFAGLDLGAYFMQQLAYPEKIRWLNSFVRPDGRGSFSAGMEMVSLVGGMIFTFVMSRVLDTYRDAGNIGTGFLICGITAVVLSILNMVSLMAADDMKDSANGVSAPTFRESMTFLAGNREVKKLLLGDILMKTGVCVATPFYGTYVIGELGFSLTTVAIFSVLYSVVRTLVSPAVGKYADKHGFSASLGLCYGIACSAFFINAFTAPGTKYLYAVYYALYAVAEAGINSGMQNINYEYIGPKNFSLALGARYALSGIAGFAASLGASAVVKAVQADGIRLFGREIYAQQLLSVLAAVILMMSMLYMKKVIAKMPKAAVRQR